MNSFVPKLGPTPLPDPITDAVVCTCPICGAMNIGAPPHGENMPCPIAIRQEAALERVAALKEKDSEREAFMMNDMKALLKNMGIIPEEDQ